MELTYLGHSCFKMVRDSFAIILDPYKTGSVPGYAPLKEHANQVVPSHRHPDHFGLKEVKLSSTRADTPFMVNIIPTFHDEEEGRLRGPNNIIIINVEGLKIIHMGDIGCMLDDEELEVLKDCDILLIPVGGYYTIDAKTAKEYVDKLNPKVTIPMHYRGDNFGYKEIEKVDGFLELFPEDEVKFMDSTVVFDKVPDVHEVVVMKPLKV